jgi:hypothetical protein
VFENGAEMIFGPKKDEVKGSAEGCIMRRFMNCICQILFRTWAGKVAHMGQKRNAYKVYVGTHKGKDAASKT